MIATLSSPYHFIYKFLVNGKFNLAVSTEILLEYEEIVQQKYGTNATNAFIALLKELPNVLHFTPYYKWQLIDTDPDDNKYSDCFIAGEASFLVTEDKHFSILKNISFPNISGISITDFIELLKSS